MDAGYEAATERAVGSAQVERLDVVVIGGGQAGLSVGYHLKSTGLRYAILEAGERIGDSWRRRWDSLRLFTPAAYDGLDGLPFPAPPGSFPTKDEMADYLETYAGTFALPVRTGVRVDRLHREGDHLVVSAGRRRLQASAVVVAMGTYQRPRVPPFAPELDPATVQLHSAAYRSPAQLGPGDLLLVGAGNSAAEIARDVSGTGRRVLVAGRDVGEIPFRMEGWLGRRVLVHVVLGLVFNHVLTVRTPLGRKARHAVLTRGGPLIRVRSADLRRLGVERVGRVAGVRAGRPLLEDGRTVEVGNVVWCTGFHGGFDWIDLPVLDARGEPRQDRGAAIGQPGLHFVGLHFQYAMSSGMIQGVGRDARRAVDRITRELARTPRRAQGLDSPPVFS